MSKEWCGRINPLGKERASTVVLNINSTIVIMLRPCQTRRFVALRTHSLAKKPGLVRAEHAVVGGSSPLMYDVFFF